VQLTERHGQPRSRAKPAMEKVIHISRSFEDCDRVDRDYYRGLDPQQRLEILFRTEQPMARERRS
jgi:hypothetical protein